MTIDDALSEWEQRSRNHFGCVQATAWFVNRVPGFQPERLTRFTNTGEKYQHVVATNGSVRIDLAPYADKPRD